MELPLSSLKQLQLDLEVCSPHLRFLPCWPSVSCMLRILDLGSETGEVIHIELECGHSQKLDSASAKLHRNYGCDMQPAPVHDACFSVLLTFPAIVSRCHTVEDNILEALTVSQSSNVCLPIDQT